MNSKKREINFIKIISNGNIMYVRAINAEDKVLHCINLASPNLAMKSVSQERVKECEDEDVVRAFESWNALSKQQSGTVSARVIQNRWMLISGSLPDKATDALVAHA